MKCKYEGSGWAEGRCMGTKEIDPCPGYEKCKRFKPDYKTNADHIRSMTDEALADYMSEHCIEDFCYIVCGGKCKAIATFNKTSGQRCREIVADWLSQPYKEAADD